MKMQPFVLLSALIGLAVSASSVLAGPYDAFTVNGVPTSSINAWADQVVSYAPTPGQSGTDTNSLGEADGAIVSLGDLDATQISNSVTPGSITVQFSQSIFNGPNADFAVFENAGQFFGSNPGYIFAELAFVEVSSDGSNFARFPSVSLNIENDGNSPLDDKELFTDFGRSFAGANTTNIHNLAGVHPAMTGTPFDLEDLVAHTLVTQNLLDLDNISYVRLVDIPGDGSFLDSLGNPILDTWLTTGSGGLDLDAVGAINAVPEPTSLVLLSLVTMLLCGTKRRHHVA